MKVLLTTLNAKYVHENLALKYLYGATLGIQRVERKEFTINNEFDYIYGEIISGGYEVICFSCYIWNIEPTLSLVAVLKRAKPELILLLGGPEVSFSQKSILLKNPSVDFILGGEGEETLPLFLSGLENLWEKDLASVDGLAYRRGDQILENPLPKPVDFAKLPFPHKLCGCQKDKVMYYESARGCPYACSYCLSSIEKQMRIRPMEEVKRELSYFLEEGVKQVKFIDRTFNFDGKRSQEILRYLTEQDNGFTNFHFELCGELIDEGLISVVKASRAGLFQFEIGVQSTNEKTLKSCNRSCDFQKLSCGVRALLKTKKAQVHLDLIAGLPYEDLDSFKKSFNQVYALEAQALQLGFLKLLCGTELFEKADDYGYRYRSKAPYEVIANHFVTAEDLVCLKRVETVLELYFNRGGFSASFAFFMGVLHQTPFDFYRDFAQSYYAGGFQHQSHKKEDLYRIFNQYALQFSNVYPEAVTELREVLLTDMTQTLNPDAIKKFNKKGWCMEP